MSQPLTYGPALILITDLLWTLLVGIGIYYGVHEVRESTKVYTWADQSHERKFNMAKLNRRAAWALLLGTTMGTILGLLVTAQDLYDYFSAARVLEIERDRFTYRVLLILKVSGTVFALMTLKRMRALWGERD